MARTFVSNTHQRTPRSASSLGKNIADFGAYGIGQFETVGNATSGDPVVALQSVTDLVVGMTMAVQGGGAAGVWHYGKITGIDTIGITVTLDVAPVRTALGTVVRQDNTAALQAAIDSFPITGEGGNLFAASGT